MEHWPEILPAFVRVDCETDEVTPIDPPRPPHIVKKPEEFGDSWSDQLTAEDKGLIRQYFSAREALRKNFGFVEVSAGGSSVTVDLNRTKGDVGIRFECPRNSLMSCIEHELFDDLLIGNYMRTTFFKLESLYPHFTPYVAKYADNGGAKTMPELGAYFRHYFMRDPVAHALRHLVNGSEMVLRTALPEGSALFRAAKRVYYDLMTR